MPNEGTTNKRLLVREFVAIAGSFSAVSPSKRPFSLANPSISLPYKKDTISIALAAIVCGVIPAAIIAIVSCSIAAWRARRADVHLRGQVARRELWEWLTGWLGLGLSFVTAFFFAQAVKNLVGKPRPDFLARCNPDSANESAYALENYDPSGFVLVDWQICQAKNGSGVGISEFDDGFRSFPSGHSSFSFSGLGYLALFLAGQCHVFRPRTDLARVLLALAPLLGAALIAISRCEDYRHDVYDVTTGSLIGILVAYYTYRRYYPPLRSLRCDTPYPNPADSAGFKSKDEENIRGAGEYELDEFDEVDDDVETRPLNSRRP